MHAKYVYSCLMDRSQAEKMWFEDILRRVEIDGTFGLVRRTNYVFRDEKNHGEPILLECSVCLFQLCPGQDACLNDYDLACPASITKEEFDRLKNDKKALKVLPKEKYEELLESIRTHVISRKTRVESVFYGDTDPERAPSLSTRRLLELEKTCRSLEMDIHNLERKLKELKQEEEHIQSVLGKNREEDPEKNVNPSD